MLLGDTTSIWRADADAAPPPAAPPPAASTLGGPFGGPFGAPKHSLAPQHHAPPPSLVAASSQSRTAVSQAQLKSMRARPEQLQPSDLAALPHVAPQHASAGLGAGAPHGNAATHLMHREGNAHVREHQLRERMHAAAVLGGDSTAGVASGGTAPMHGLLPQRRTVDPTGVHNVTSGEAPSGTLPGALQPCAAPHRLREAGSETRGQAGAAAFQMGPKTAALLEQVDSRSLRSAWQS